VLPAAGTDRWVAVSVADSDQWQQTQALAGGRPLEEWSATHSDRELVQQLRAIGVMAGSVADIEDLAADADLAARGALVDLPHPLLGAFAHVRTPIRFSADPCTPFRAPRIGEHTREVALSIAGMNTERFAALKSAGVLE
jgi:crotonobetainyl-CoA:carnitine CoA-transferase CaiB-like acyl-CoA transferase